MHKTSILFFSSALLFHLILLGDARLSKQHQKWQASPLDTIPKQSWTDYVLYIYHWCCLVFHHLRILGRYSDALTYICFFSERLKKRNALVNIPRDAQTRTTAWTWTGSVPWFQHGLNTVSKTLLRSHSNPRQMPNRSSIHGFRPARSVEMATKRRVASRPGERREAVAGEISAPRQWRSERWCHRKYHMSASESLPALIIFGPPFILETTTTTTSNIRTPTHTHTLAQSQRFILLKGFVPKHSSVWRTNQAHMNTHMRTHTGGGIH